jgi:phosphohistidine phosphatase
VSSVEPGTIRVYLVRHARAEKEAPRGDAARSLTAEGRAAFAALLADLGPRIAVSRALASPFTRARETAELLAAATGAPIEDEPELGSGNLDGPGVLALARRAGAGCALVGHNPEIGEAIALAAGEPHEVSPGTVAAIDLERGGPRLAWIASPR